MELSPPPPSLALMQFLIVSHETCRISERSYNKEDTVIDLSTVMYFIFTIIASFPEFLKLHLKYFYCLVAINLTSLSAMKN